MLGRGSFVPDRLELVDNEVEGHVGVGGVAFSGVDGFGLEGPFGDIYDLVSEGGEFHVGIVLSEVIDTLFGEVGFNKVEAVGYPSVGDGLMEEESCGFPEDGGNCFKIEFIVDEGGEKGFDLFLRKKELVRHFLGKY